MGADCKIGISSDSGILNHCLLVVLGTLGNSSTQRCGSYLLRHGICDKIIKVK